MYSFSNINTLQADLKTGKTNCTSLVEEAISLISQKKQLNAFLEVFEDSAKELAKKTDEKIKAGTAGK